MEVREDLFLSPTATACPGRLVCHCLQVTLDMVQTVLQTQDITTVKELRAATGAGQGCTACIRRLNRCLEESRRQSSSPSLTICSVR